MPKAPTFPQDNLQAIATVPPTYACTSCGATGGKLWRETIGVRRRGLSLACATCYCLATNLKLADLDPRMGTYSTTLGQVDCCGLYVPAIPTEDGLGFWQYRAAPADDADWWRNLPLVA